MWVGGYWVERGSLSGGWVVGYWVYWVVGIGDCDRVGSG